MKKMLFLLLTYIALVPSSFADIYVVAHKEAQIEHLSKDEVTALFLGKKRTLPNGELAFMIDRGLDSTTRSEFFYLLNKMSLPRVNAYWSRLTFSGRMIPPTVIEQEAEMLVLLSEKTNAISYTNQKPTDSEVSIILSLK
ncbi:membrane protein [Aliivibrio wodanis]|uniref:Membrane protein n=1 Tax=Aliivibrio wodanis TaxID=80852 RepID=A0A090IV49_9GAMM|nr:membrane protein [Aliivibrio wodanis]VVV04948.1 hypothetical protein AW0309160_02358 [Aliivibrio wodanis]